MLCWTGDTNTRILSGSADQKVYSFEIVSLCILHYGGYLLKDFYESA